MDESADRPLSALDSSQMLRLLSIGVIAVLLLAPIAMIFGLISERRGRRDEAVADVSAKWGNRQTIVGPALVVLYTYRWVDTPANGQPIVRTESRNAIFLPQRLRARGTLDADMRSRGIFSIPVYKLDLTLDGEFAPIRFAEIGLEPAAVDWDRAHLAVGIADVRAIQKQTEVSWNGRRVAFVPGTGGFTDYPVGIKAMVGADASSGFTFSFPLSLNGSLGLYLVPFARDTEVELKSNSANPSFQGNWLPADRAVSDKGFTARWSVSSLGRNYPQVWTSAVKMRESIDASRFGLELVGPVDNYRMAERSVKYAPLFILLTLGSVWLIEVLAGVRAHPIQYLLLGAALCVFYLLELSLSEHLGFLLAYALASVAVVTMVGAYSRVVLQRTGRAAIVSGGAAALYFYLFVLLQNEDYALLIGSIGLFVILGTVMFVTSRVNWYAIGSSRASPGFSR
jgi:inner membrane protein